MIKKLILFLLGIIILSCGNPKSENNKNDKLTADSKEMEIGTENQDTKIVNEEIKKTVQEWNEATSNKDLITLESLLGDNIIFYQKSITKEEYIKNRTDFFNKYNIYKQIVKGDVNVVPLSSNQVRVNFVKEVTTIRGVNQFPVFLVFEKIGDQWKLILESDTISDVNKVVRKSQNENESKNNYSSGTSSSGVGANNSNEGQLSSGGVATIRSSEKAETPSGNTTGTTSEQSNKHYKGDASETYTFTGTVRVEKWYHDGRNLWFESNILVLPQSINVDGHWVKELHLFHGDARFRDSNLSGKTITVTGRLMEGHTIYHRTDYVITDMR